MILPPFAAPQDFKSGVILPDSGEALWFIFSKDCLLVRDDKKTLPMEHEFVLQRVLYLGTYKVKHLFAAEIELESQASTGWQWIPLRALYSTLLPEVYSIAGRAMQLIHWDRANEYCGHCGSLTFSHTNERCRECNACGQLNYPKMSMAILALIRREDQILLARSLQFPDSFYSILAGFVEPGETLEQCVVREVFEEVGIKVKNVKYYGNQPWPFSHSLMIAFTCEWQEGEIQINPTEIAEATWFDMANLPSLPPTFSLSRILIDEFVKEFQN